MISQSLKRLEISVQNLVEICQLFPLLRRDVFVADLFGELDIGRPIKEVVQQSIRTPAFLLYVRREVPSGIFMYFD